MFRGKNADERWEWVVAWGEGKGLGSRFFFLILPWKKKRFVLQNFELSCLIYDESTLNNGVVIFLKRMPIFNLCRLQLALNLFLK